MTTNYQSSHTPPSEQPYQNVDAVGHGIDDKVSWRILHQGLGRAVGHVHIPFKRCLFVVCPNIGQAKKEPIANILGQGEERDLNPCPSVLTCYERR